MSNAEIIGAGHEGKVIRIRKASGDVAVKYIALKPGKGLRSITEIGIMTFAKKHPGCHLMTYRRITIDSVSIQIEMDIAMNTLQERPPQKQEEKILCISQMVRAVIFLHRNGLVHGDIKPDNILLFHDGYRLSDFGHTTIPEGRIPYGGTSNYRAPEVWDGKGYGQKADLWALGCTIHFIRHECPLFPQQLKDNHYPKAIEIWFGRLPRIRLVKQPTRDRNFLPSYCDDLINRLTEYLPNERIDLESESDEELLCTIPQGRFLVHKLSINLDFEQHWSRYEPDVSLKKYTQTLWERSSTCPIDANERFLCCYSIARRIHRNKRSKILPFTNTGQESIIRCLGYDILTTFE